MPRKAPKEVIEHRISLSNFERDLLKETILEQRENSLYVAGINQIGQIAGSGVLLYGLGLYFGISLFSSAKEKVDEFIDTTSTAASTVLTEIFGGLTPEEAAWYGDKFDLLDERIRQLNRKETFDNFGIQGATSQMASGEISYDEGKAILDKIALSQEETENERKSIQGARAKLKQLQAQSDQGYITQINWGSPAANTIVALIMSL